MRDTCNFVIGMWAGAEFRIAKKLALRLATLRIQLYGSTYHHFETIRTAEDTKRLRLTTDSRGTNLLKLILLREKARPLSPDGTATSVGARVACPQCCRRLAPRLLGEEPREPENPWANRQARAILGPHRSALAYLSETRWPTNLPRKVSGSAPSVSQGMNRSRPRIVHDLPIVAYLVHRRTQAPNWILSMEDSAYLLAASFSAIARVGSDRLTNKSSPGNIVGWQVGQPRCSS